MVRKTYKFHDITIPQSNDPTKTISKDNYISPDHHGQDGMIGFEAADATLVSNVLTPVDSVVVVRGEGASTDVLDHITYGSTPDIDDLDLLWLQRGAETITINHNTSSPPSNSGPVLLLSQVNQLMPSARMVLLQRQGNNFQEIAFSGIVGNGGILVTDDAGQAIVVCGSVASAVNYLKVTNAATGNDVIIEPDGSDSDIGIQIKKKGTGKNTIENTHIDIAGILGLPATQISIATGALAASVAQITVDAETGTSDTLDTITGLANDDIVALVAKTGDTITVTHDVGGADSLHLTEKIDSILSETVPIFFIRKGGELYQFAGPEIMKVELAFGKPADALATGDKQITFVMPQKGRLIKAKAYVDTVSSSGLPTFALRESSGGVDIFSTNLTIDVSEKTSLTAATPVVIKSDGTEILDADEVVYCDVDVAGTGTLGAILTLWFINLSDE